jgi:hypothetical protein
LYDGGKGGNGGNGGDGGTGGSGPRSGSGGGGGDGGNYGTGGKSANGKTGANGSYGEEGKEGDPGMAGAAPTLAAAVRASDENADASVELTSLASSSASTAAPAATLSSRWRDFVDQLSYIFFNQSPSLAPTVSGQSGSNKEITVKVNAVSNNGFPVTYSVKTPPKYGSLTFDETTARYKYTPNAEFVTPGISDTFTITVNNGTAAQLPGFAGFIQGVLHSFAIAMGIAKPDSTDRQIAVSVLGTGVYGGDVTELAKLHRQQSYWNCVLMASAMAAAQVTGTETLPEDVTVEWAKELDSVVIPGRKMYLSELIDLGTFPKDAVRLMEKHYPVTAVNTVYGTYDANGNRVSAATLADGQRALNDMNAALEQGKAVTIAINNWSLYSSRPNWSAPRSNLDYTIYNHQIQVLKVDIANGKVWVNDSALETGGQEFSLSAVMKAWQVSDYDLTVVAQRP